MPKTQVLVVVLGLALVLGPALAQSPSAARVLEQAGQLEQAMKEYHAVLEQKPDNIQAYQGFYRVCLRLARYDSLEAVSLRLSELKPDQPQYVLGRTDGLLGLKRKKEATALCGNYVKRWPYQATALVDVLERWKEYGTATSALLTARQSHANSLVYADRLVALYELQDRYAEATREIVRLCGSDPDLVRNHLEKLGEFARKAGASGILAELAKLEDPWARARAQAEVYLAIGKEAEALKVARQAMGPDGLYGFAHECEEEGAFNAALAVYQEQGLRADEARVLRKLGRNNEALTILAQEKNPKAWFELAEINRLELKNLSAAAANYERVLRMRRGNERAAFGLASSYIGLGRLDEARKSLISASRQTDRVLLLLARVFLYKSDLDSAKYYSQELVRRYPNSPLGNDGLEIALLCAGGERASELAQAMYEQETGAQEKALARCQTLGRGNDDVAQMAWFLRAQILRDAGQPRQAVAVLDSFALAFPESTRRPKQLMTQADVFAHDLKDEGLYRRKLEDVAVSFPGSPYAPVARSLLAEANRPVEPEMVR